MDLKERLKNIVHELDIRPYVKLVVLFGSQARGDSHARSDVDVAFLVEEELLQLRNPLHLRAELMGKLSLELGKDCDVVIINRASPLLKYQVVKYGEVVYCDDQTAYNTFFSRVVVEHCEG